MESWTLSNEYDLKKVRDRQFFAGQFIWSGWDYIGEPTPYTTFPVKTSFFGLVDTAGFPKDGYYLFKSQWTTAPMVHIVPMNWTDYKPGRWCRYGRTPTSPRCSCSSTGSRWGPSRLPRRRRRSAPATWRRRSAPATTRRSPAGPARAATRARTAARAISGSSGTSRSSPAGWSPWPRTRAATWSPVTSRTPPGGRTR